MKTITAIIAITSLTIVALVNQIDGALVGLAATIIGGLGGYEARKLYDTRKRRTTIKK